MYGRINMRCDGAAMCAEDTLKPDALLQVAGFNGLRTDHIEVAMWSDPAPVRIRLK